MEKEYTGGFGRLDDDDFDFDAFLTRCKLADAPSLASSFMDCSPQFLGHVLDSNQVGAIKGYLNEMSYMRDDEITGETDVTYEEMYEASDEEEDDDSDDWQCLEEEIDDRYSRMAEEYDVSDNDIDEDLNKHQFWKDSSAYMEAIHLAIRDSERNDGWHGQDNADDHKANIKKDPLFRVTFLHGCESWKKTRLAQSKHKKGTAKISDQLNVPSSIGDLMSMLD